MLKLSNSPNHVFFSAMRIWIDGFRPALKELLELDLNRFIETKKKMDVNSEVRKN